ACNGFEQLKLLQANMPKRPKIPKRATGNAGNAVMIMRVPTNEEAKDFPINDGKDKAAQSLDQRGGKARARGLSAKKRKEIAKAAAERKPGTTVAITPSSFIRRICESLA